MSVRWTYIDPATVFNPFIGFQTVLIALIGGAATLWGPLIAAVVFSLLAETLRLQVPQLYMMALGLLLILSRAVPAGRAGVAARSRRCAGWWRDDDARRAAQGGAMAERAARGARRHGALRRAGRGRRRQRRLRAGELVGIIGPNGAGKTTFFNALSGVHRADLRASCSLGGQRLTGARAAPLSRSTASRAPSRRRACSPS